MTVLVVLLQPYRLVLVNVLGHAVAHLVQTLLYKTEGRGFDYP